jgi:group I intron endonuclease
LRSGIYFIQNILTGCIYVGQAKCITQRKAAHLCELRKGTHRNSYLQRAWNKYGEQAFRFGVLERCPLDKLCEREQWWMDHHGVGDMSKTYNLDTVAQSSRGRKVSEATREKIRAALRKTLSDPALRERSRERAKRLWAEGVFKPQVFTIETREKMRVAAKRRASDPAYIEFHRQKAKRLWAEGVLKTDSAEMIRRNKIRWSKRGLND